MSEELLLAYEYSTPKRFERSAIDLRHPRAAFKSLLAKRGGHAVSQTHDSRTFLNHSALPRNQSRCVDALKLISVTDGRTYAGTSPVVSRLQERHRQSRCQASGRRGQEPADLAN
jgi:hypothetical protein